MKDIRCILGFHKPKPEKIREGMNEPDSIYFNCEGVTFRLTYCVRCKLPMYELTREIK